jgi:hypothetical protein
MSRQRHRPPTLRQLKEAHRVFSEKEARDLFYRVATDLVDRAFSGGSALSVGESVAVLLATWNRRFYQRGRRCDRRHVDQIDQAIRDRYQDFVRYRGRTLESLIAADRPEIATHFAYFESFLGRVGVAKCFHLLAPRFFPLWDTAIAAEYGVPLRKAGRNAERYYTFMLTVKADIERLGGRDAVERAAGISALKALDEYAYCKFTAGWI